MESEKDKKKTEGVIPFIPLNNKIQIHHLLSLYLQLTKYLHHH